MAEYVADVFSRKEHLDDISYGYCMEIAETFRRYAERAKHEQLEMEQEEKKLPEGLEEAAHNFAIHYDNGTCDGIAQDCFIAGAEWQKKLDDLETADLLAIAHLQGMEQQKAKMMEDAVEGKVFMSFAPGHNQVVMADVDLPTNTKVKVIIVKEDEK